MQRATREHINRETADLSGLWDFEYAGDVAMEGIVPSAFRFWESMPVPGCFDATPRYAGKRGVAAYRTFVTARRDGLYRLWLDGVHHYCRVFVDGTLVGEHSGGFTRFSIDFEVRNDHSLRHEIVVLADNRIDYDICPLHLDYFDWYHYGGIARGARLDYLGELWVESVRVDTVDYRSRSVRVAVDVGATRDVAGSIDITVDGASVYSGQVTPSRSVTDESGYIAGTIVEEFQLPDAALWSPASPALHTLEVNVTHDGGTDDAITRFGIRQIEVSGRELLLNGESLRLFGFNRHEAHPHFGHAVPAQIHAYDLQILKSMGCNFVRGSHYPQDQSFVDMCDEAGMLVWCESIGWQHTPEHLGDPRFVELQMQNATEMVRALYNSPSVVMWGLLNESESHKAECRPAYERLISHLRSLDSSRPVTYASNHPFDDVCLDLVDIVSINTYPGWYGSEIDQLPRKLEEIANHIDAAGFGDRPMILSEIGAGAVPGFRDWNRARWSEEYQVALIEAVVNALEFGSEPGRPVGSNRWVGLGLWQFCDIRASAKTERMLGRPRGFNNKGVVDEWRRPKMAYHYLCERFGAKQGGSDRH